MTTANKISFKNKYKQIPANPIRLILEISLCLLLIIPTIMWGVLKLFLKSSRKNIKGQVVLVSFKNAILNIIITKIKVSFEKNV